MTIQIRRKTVTVTITEETITHTGPDAEPPVVTVATPWQRALAPEPQRTIDAHA